MNLQEYYTRFSADEKLIADIMSEALSQGGDYCDLFFQYSVGNHIGLEDNAVNRAHSHVDFGVGIRVLKGEQTGYSFTDEVTPQSMKLAAKTAAKTAAKIADSNKTVSPVQVKLQRVPNYYPIEIPWGTVPVPQKIPYLQKINDAVFAEVPWVVKCSISFGEGNAYILIATSEGRMVL